MNPIATRAERWFTPLLVGTALGIYALVIIGATVSATDGAAACSTWPTCDGQWLVPLSDLTLVVAMGHRFLSLIVGILLVTITAAAWIIETSRAVRSVLLVMLCLFPFQIGLGALTALSGGAAPYPFLHLVIAVIIFLGILITLVWWLEAQTKAIPSRFAQGETEISAEPTVESPAEQTEITGTAKIAAYIQLTKPRLMWLLCFVAIAGIGLATAATGYAVTRELVVGTLLGGVLAIGSSGTFNHVLERDVDKKMNRTADRPTAKQALPVRNVVLFGVALGIASIATFLYFVNPLAAFLGVTAIIFYSIIYTVVLKPNTTQNIVIGGAVGAIPALIGWAAVTGSIGIPALVLGGLIFLWTPAHFYNLALAYKEDYARGGFPMLPIERGDAVTLRHIAWYFGATLIAAVVLGMVAPLGIGYAATVIAFAAIFLLAIVELYRSRTHKAAFRSFHASNAFLGIIMLVIIIETLLL